MTSAGKLGGPLGLHRTKSDKMMELEQRYIIKFFMEEGKKGKKIIERLQRHYGTDALARSTVYKWMNELKRGRTDLTNIPSPGRPREEELARAIAHKHEEDPHLSARKLAQYLGIAHSTVCSYLSEVLQMKCLRLRWVPHTLSIEQKAKRAEYAGEMLRILQTHESTGFHFLFTGDESWIFYSYNHRTQWVASWEELDEVERPSHYHRKTMVTVFFNGTGDFLIDILPEGLKMNSTYFANNIIDVIAGSCYPNGRQPHSRKVMLHFDNAPIHSTDTVNDRMTLRELERMKHPPYSSDLAPCDFFLFGYLKENLANKQYATPDDMLLEVTSIIRGISPDLRASVFANWRRLTECWNSGGEYVE
jgi:histone-lysine N-methyltransferase SETMAR